jgi:uncharacterized protein (UPF0276 family)
MIGRISFKSGDRDCDLILDHAALYLLETKHKLTPAEIAAKISNPTVLHALYLVGMQRAKKRFDLKIDTVNDEYIFDILGEMALTEMISVADEALTLSLLGKKPEETEDEPEEDSPKA